MNKVKEIFKQTTDYQILCYYLSPYTNSRNLRSSEKILSPLRDEKNPSFNIYETAKGWSFKDYGGEQGNCFRFVMLLFNLTFEGALDKIITDLNLEIAKENSETKTDEVFVHSENTTGKSYKIINRPFTEPELEFWSAFGITKEILLSYRVITIGSLEGFSKKKNKPYRMNSNSDKFLFGYTYGKTCIKIYQPKAAKEHRFFYLDPKERDELFVFGLEQLPIAEKTVIWTGGEKDVMSLRAMGYYAITGTSETGRIPAKVIEDLKERGVEVIIMFDNDKTGMEKSAQFAKDFGFKRAVLPEMTGGKDISDYVKLKLPIDEIFQLIKNAEAVAHDDDSIKLNVEDLKQNDALGLPITDVSDTEFSYDIWIFRLTKKDGVILKGLCRNGVMQFLNQKGFYKRCRDNNTYMFVKDEANIIDEVLDYMMKDMVLNYIRQQPEGIKFDYGNSKIEVSNAKQLEIFLNQSHIIFNKTFLTQLSNHEKPILKDEKDVAYFYFRNQVVEVTANGLKYRKYSELNGTCIWLKQIKEREFEYVKENQGCHFALFIKNVTNNEPERGAAFVSAIGYLLHNHIQPTSGQAVIANDEEITDLKNPMGGTGKGLLANGIKQIRNVVKIDGKKFDHEDKFRFQDINDSTQVVWLDDIKPDFAFETFHSCLTDGWSIEKKNQDQFFIKPEDSPKMLICGNSVISGVGTTNKRRMFTIEFSNHYSKKIKTGIEEPIKDEHGCTFFDKEEWNQDEWNKFYSYMLDCVCYYLKNGLKYYEHKSLEQNRLRQSTSEEFCDWVVAQSFHANIEYDTAKHFKEFVTTYYGEGSDFKQRGFTNWLSKFATSKKWEMKSKRSNSVSKFVFIGDAVKKPESFF